jgi:hypothetical protein
LKSAQGRSAKSNEQIFNRQLLVKAVDQEPWQK